MRIIRIMKNSLKTNFAFFGAFLVFTFAVFNGACFAAPSILKVSGTISHNSTAIIEGQSFGAKDSGAPIVWDDFENGTNGQSVASTGFWRTDGTAPTFSTSYNRNSSSLNVKAVLAASSIDGNYHDIFYRSGLSFSSRRIYVNFWLRFDPGTGDDYYQVKTWRVVNGGESSDYPSIACFPHPGTSRTWYYYQLTREDKSAQSFTFPAFTPGRWVNVTAQIYTGTVGNSNGSIEIWHGNKKVVNVNGINIYRGSNAFDSVRFGEFIGNGGRTATNYFDNIYVDNSWARVEIGDNANFESCTHREIQIPNSWTSNSITVNINNGSFSEGQTAYLFVVDSDGNASQGHAVIIGDTSSSDSVPSPAPTPDPEPTPEEDSQPSADASAWSATSQTGDANWKNSTLSYCVRLLIEGDQISGSANQVKLGFQGRSSGSYTIRNVSIAERDASGGVGDVVDSTWKQVTFDGAAWGNSASVAANAEKVSDPVSLSLKAGTDYYVTFKIDSPSVYLNPQSGYQELYFDSADHTSDIDWGGNGFSVTNDYHALSNIYLVDENGENIAAPTNLRVVEN